MKPVLRLPWLVTGVLAMSSLSVHAQSVGVGVNVGVGSSTANVRAGDDAFDRFCVRHTGTRIVPRPEREQSQRRRCSGFAGRSYSREDLESTGRHDMADALRALDPSIR